MKKKILAIILSVCLIFTAFSGVISAFADTAADIRSAVLSAFNTYVAENGNASTQSGLVSYINEAISETGETVTASDFYIYHAADGCYDTNTGLNAIYKIDIKGHDGYVSALFNVSNSDSFGTAASIPHIDEDLGDLTTVTFSADNEDFELDENSNIKAYTGNAEKIIVPYNSSSTTTFASNAMTATASNGTNNLGNVKAIVLYSKNESVKSNAFKDSPNLKALVFGKYQRFYNEACVANCSNLKYIQMPYALNKAWYHSTTGNGIVYYGAFQNSTKLQNIYFVRYYDDNGSGMTLKGQYPQWNICSYATYQGNVFNNTALLDFYYQASNTGTGLNSGGTTIGSSASVAGTRIGPAVYSATNSTLGMAAAKVAKQLSNAEYVEGTSTGETIKSAAIDGITYDEMTASWNDTFVGADGVASGVLTVSNAGVDYLMSYNYNPYEGLSGLTVSKGTLTPAFDSRTYEYSLSLNTNISSISVTATPAEGATTTFENGVKAIPFGESEIVIDTVTSSGALIAYTISVYRAQAETEIEDAIKNAFNSFVSTNKNATTQADLLTFVNGAVSDLNASVTVDDFFIYHAADGCFDEGDATYPVKIPGHDGYVSAVFNISKNGNFVVTKGFTATIPHLEENLGTLTTEVYYQGSPNFSLSAAGNINAYFGSAEKIVIPYIEGHYPSFVSNAASTVIEGKTNTLNNVKVIMTYSNRKLINPRAFANTTNLKAVVFGAAVRDIREKIFDGSSVKYLLMSSQLNYNTNYCRNASGETGNGSLDYGAFQNARQLQNIVLANYRKWSLSDRTINSYAAYNMPDYCTYNASGNIYANNALLDLYYNGSGTSNIGANTAGSASVSGTRVGPAKWSTTTSSLAKAAVLAQKKANTVSYSSQESVKTTILSGFTCDGIAAEWQENFVVDGTAAKGTLNLVLDDKEVEIEYDYNPNAGLRELTVDGYSITPDFDSSTTSYSLTVLPNVEQVNVSAYVANGATTGFVSGPVSLAYGTNTIEIATTTISGANVTYTLSVTRLPVPTELVNSIKASFNTYVQNKGNNVESGKLISYINKQISPAFVELKENGFYIRHAVDGCYGENEDGLEFSIPGNDGSVVATMNVYDNSGSLVYELGHLASISHTEEDLGTLSYEEFDQEEAENDDGYSFGIDANGYITSYTGEAEMIIIPSTYSGRINMANTTNDSVKVIIVGDRSSTAMNVSFGNHSINNWENLRAVVLPKQIKSDIGINSFAFAYNPALKYVNLPNGINTTSNGYGTFGNEAFRDCPVLENARASESGKLPSCQFRTEIFRGTSVRDYLVEGYFQFGSGASMANISDYPIFTEGTQNLLAGNGNGSSVGANFVRAVALAQETADKYAVTNENKDTVLSSAVASYSSKISGITAEFVGTDSIKFTYDGISISAICNKSGNYNKAIDLVMGTTPTIRNEDPSGLRFSCTVNGLAALEADDSVSDVALGMLIVPTDYILTTGFSKFDLTELGVDYLDISKEYFVSGTTMNMVISDILPENYNRSFSAIAYAQITYSDTHTEIVYSNSYVSAKLYDLAVANNITTITSAVDVNKPGNHLAAADFIDSASGNSDAAAKAKRASVISSVSSEIPASYTGTTYNIAKGTSTASITSIISGLQSGDKVLFERGGIYRICIDVPCNNLYFGAYGEGEKPYIYGSLKNFADSSWTKDSGNIWYVSGVTTLSNNDAGIVVFNQGEAVGTKVNAKSHLTADGYFWYDATNKRVYLYSEVNPATRFQSIEIGVNDYIFDITGKSGITIDNLALKYTGGHGISLQYDSHDVTITNCEIGFVGGSLMTHTTTNTIRYGNGIELWNGGYNITVDNCWIYQVYDSGITHQGTGTVAGNSVFTQNNITVSNNLVEYCSLACIEYWASDSGSATQFNTMSNIAYTNNILRFGGYGFGNMNVDWDIKPGFVIYSSASCLNMLGKVSGTTTPTFTISGNVFDTAKSALVQLVNKHSVSGFPILSGNTYMQIGGRKLAVYGHNFTAQDSTVYTPATYYADSNGSAFINSKDLTATVTVY